MALLFPEGKGLFAFLPEKRGTWNEPVELFQRNVHLVTHPVGFAASRGF